MQRAMARQAEAERERRAKIINAEGEFQAAAKLSDAADVISRNPTTIQLRYLQTLLEVGNSQSSTIVFPLPLDLVKPLLEAGGGTLAGAARAATCARSSASAPRPRPRPRRPPPMASSCLAATRSRRASGSCRPRGVSRARRLDRAA